MGTEKNQVGSPVSEHVEQGDHQHDDKHRADTAENDPERNAGNQNQNKGGQEQQRKADSSGCQE